MVFVQNKYKVPTTAGRILTNHIDDDVFTPPLHL